MIPRRRFLALVAALATGLAIAPSAPAKAETIDYAPGMIEELLAEGRTLFVSFAASWCGMCQMQKEAVDRWRAEDPAFDANITFVRVDWDTYEDHEVVARHAIPRRSTLIVLKGDEELGRIETQTDPEAIRALMETARDAAAGSS